MIKDKDKCSTQADFDITGCNLGEDFISRKVQSDFKKIDFVSWNWALRYDFSAHHLILFWLLLSYRS